MLSRDREREGSTRLIVGLGVGLAVAGGITLAARAAVAGDERHPVPVRPVSGQPFSFFKEPGRPEHLGVDVEGAEGEPIRAVWPGRVVHVQTRAIWQRREPGSAGDKAGAYVDLLHELSDLPAPVRQHVQSLGADALKSRYLHAHDITVRQGDVVAAGDVLGPLGRTGVRESRTHVHFETRLGRGRYGVAIDPLTLGVFDG